MNENTETPTFKLLEKYDPERVSGLISRFKLTLDEVAKDERFQYLLKAKLEADKTLEESGAEITRLKRRVNGLLSGILGKKAAS